MRYRIFLLKPAPVVFDPHRTLNVPSCPSPHLQPKDAQGKFVAVSLAYVLEMTKFICACLNEYRCAGAARPVRGAVRASAGTDELDITQVQNTLATACANVACTLLCKLFCSTSTLPVIEVITTSCE